jgi:hypothetical protein
MSTPLRPTRRVALATGLGTLALMATGCSERGRFFAVPGAAAAHHFSGQTMGSSYNVKLAGTGLHDTLLRTAEQAVSAALQGTVRHVARARQRTFALQPPPGGRCRCRFTTPAAGAANGAIRAPRIRRQL